MNISVKLMEKLACPACKGVITQNGVGLKCVRCGTVYNVDEGIPRFLPEPGVGGALSEQTGQDLNQESNFYERMFSRLQGIQDGRCVVYGYDQLYEFMSNVAKGTLLDVGCGAGHHSKDLALMGFEVTGIDVSRNGLMHAQSVSETSKTSIDYVLGDCARLPFQDRSFDVVFCSLILHHFLELDKVLYELARVSKCKLIAFEVNSYDPLSFLRFNILNPLFGSRRMSKNQRCVSPLGLVRALDKLGLEAEELRYVDVHNAIGRDPNGFTAGLVRIYQAVMRPLPERFRFNKFLLRCRKVAL